VLTLGIARRVLDGSPRRVGLVVALGLVSALSVLSNPLFLLWATAPVVLILLVRWVRSREVPVLWMAGALAVGAIVGYVGRIPLAPFIANDGLGYIDVTRAGQSAAYYGRLVAELASTPGGAVSLALTAVLLATSVVCSIRLRGTDRPGALVVATAGWVVPLVVVVAAVVLGTNAARYVQPVVYAPIAALVVLPDVLPRLRRPAWRIAALVTGAAVVVASLALGVPRLVTAADRADADLSCVTSWVDASGRTGAGQYWTVRLPKAHVADPRSLVQVDDALRPYDWLVDRADAEVGSVSFLVLDDQSPPFTLPGGVTLSDATTVSCGRYTIADFGDLRLPLGSPRS
jgi:hypothetical protein